MDLDRKGPSDPARWTPDLIERSLGVPYLPLLFSSRRDSTLGKSVFIPFGPALILAHSLNTCMGPAVNFDHDGEALGGSLSNVYQGQQNIQKARMETCGVITNSHMHANGKSKCQILKATHVLNPSWAAVRRNLTSSLGNQISTATHM